MDLGRTALHYAAIENNVNGALLLLKYGANIEAQDEHVRSVDRRKNKNVRSLSLSFVVVGNAIVQSCV